MLAYASLEKPGFWRARVGPAEQLNAPELHPAIDELNRWMHNQYCQRCDLRQHYDKGPQAFAVQPLRWGRDRTTERQRLQGLSHFRPSGRGIGTAHGPAWAAPRYTGSDDQSLQPIQRCCSDWSKVRAPKGDRQRARPFDYDPHGTWSGIAQKQRPDGEGDSPYHPAEGFLEGKTMSGSARVRHIAEFMRSMYPAFSRRATQVCVLSSALEKIAYGAHDARAVALAALNEADAFGWKQRASDKSPEHVCGLQGYNGMIDPPCPACEANRVARTIAA